MPGPSNGRKRHQKKKKKSAFFLATTTTQSNEPKLNAHGIDGARAEATHSLRPSQENNQEQQHSQRIVKPNDGVERLWNGPRVIDVVAFLESSYAARPSFDDRDCAEFACEEMKRIFSQLLPEDTGLMLWYNTSRKRARICPACRRFYNLGDKLAPHVLGSNPLEAEHEQDPRNEREQEISGICSLVCFGIASYSWPGCIGVWGKWEDEIDPDTLLLLNSPGRGIADEGLGALMKVIRSSDVTGIARDFIAHDLVWY